MTDGLDVLLTNDDGIDAPGIRVVADHLRDANDVASVTLAAPAKNQSGTGQTRTHGAVTYEERDDGYAVVGTPADCVALGVAALDCDPDLVVSGCNDGPNLGAHILGRSGTVGAAMEAGFLELPAVAVSMYDWEFSYDAHYDPGPEKFHVPADVVADLAPRFARGDVLPTADYLSINAPSGDVAENPVYRVTRPSEEYELEATVTEEGVNVEDRFWTEFVERRVPDPEGTDRRACVDEEVSVTPLTAPHGIAPGVTAGGLL